MPLIAVNIEGEALADPRAVRRALARALSAAPDAPVIAMLHGYKYAPSHPLHSPHDHILGLAPCASWKARSWPRALGVGADAGADGGADGGAGSGGPEPICLAVGWQARGSIWSAYTQAALAGRALARLIALVRSLVPDKPVQAIGHSLGARVILCALPDLEPGALARAVLLTPAELRPAARAAIASPAGRAARILCVGSRENAAFDATVGFLLAPMRLGGGAIGAGLGQREGRWVDLRIDRPGARAALGQLGHDIPAADRWCCHWSVYLRPGVFRLYRDVLTGALPFDRLAAVLAASALPDPAAPGASGGSQLRMPGLARLPFARGRAS